MSRRGAGAVAATAAVLGAGLAILGCAGAAQAQGAWPAKPVRMVVPFPPGGAPDILGRLVGQRLGAVLGQSVVIDNKPGAGGAIGAESVAKAAPDGYTLLMTTTSTQSIHPSLYPNLPYDSVRDFSPVSLVAYTQVMLAAANDVPAKNLAELIAHAKANPGKLTYASAGAGSVQHIAGVMFDGQAGIRTLHIAYKGTGQLMPDLVAGRVSMMFNSIAALIPMVRDGKLRALAVTGAKRSGAAPDIPTFAEAGLAGFDASAWYAVFGPAALPREVVQRLAAELGRIVASPELRERYAALGLDPASSTPEELARIVRDDTAKWSAVIKANNITAQ